MGTTGDEGSPIASIADWDRAFTDQELQAIEAAFQSATSSSSSSSIKRRHVSPNDDEHRSSFRRRLPYSIASTPMRISDSFSLSPCSRNRFYTPRRDSSEAKLMVRYPTLTFRGHITYSRTANEVDKAAKQLLEIVEARKGEGSRVILGFDIEWKPTFRRGVPPGKAAVMQICGDTSNCYVMHIIHSGIPQSLQSLLEDPTSLKVGVGVTNDAYKIFNDYNVSVKALEELSGLANQKVGGDPRNWSLASLAEKVICKQLPKPGKIRLGNWEIDVLSKDQLQYAATDAFASWYLYEALKSLPEASGNRSEEMDKETIYQDDDFC